MANAARYEKGIRRVRKGKPADVRVLAKDLHDNLVDNLASLPTGMAEELAHFYFGAIDSGRSVGDYYDLAYHCILIFDLMDGEYGDHGEDQLKDQEWDFIKGLFNDYADELDEDVLTTVMSSIVSQGKL